MQVCTSGLKIIHVICSAIHAGMKHIIDCVKLNILNQMNYNLGNAEKKLILPHGTTCKKADITFLITNGVKGFIPEKSNPSVIFKQTQIKNSYRAVNKDLHTRIL